MEILKMKKSLMIFSAVLLLSISSAMACGTCGCAPAKKKTPCPKACVKASCDKKVSCNKSKCKKADCAKKADCNKSKCKKTNCTKKAACTK